MTVDEAVQALKELNEEGYDNEQIVQVLYVMFQRGQIDLDAFESLSNLCGYELTDGFKKMSLEEQKKAAFVGDTKPVHIEEPPKVEPIKFFRTTKSESKYYSFCMGLIINEIKRTSVLFDLDVNVKKESDCESLITEKIEKICKIEKEIIKNIININQDYEQLYDKSIKDEFKELHLIGVSCIFSNVKDLNDDELKRLQFNARLGYHHKYYDCKVIRYPEEDLTVGYEVIIEEVNSSDVKYSKKFSHIERMAYLKLYGPALLEYIKKSEEKEAKSKLPSWLKPRR